MRVSIRDEGALKGVSPSAMSAYARAVGWEKEDPYGDHSDVYVRRGAPEIVIPGPTVSATTPTSCRG